MSDVSSLLSLNFSTAGGDLYYFPSSMDIGAQESWCPEAIPILFSE